MGKRILTGAVNALCIVAILFSLVAGWVVLSTPRGKAPTLLGTSLMTVLTGSMEPVLPEKSFIIVRKTPPEDIAPQDIITFYAHIGGHDGVINTHRVVELTQQDGTLAFRTKGDANTMVDPTLVLPSQLIGKVVWHSPLLGHLVTVMRSPLIFLPLVLIPLLLIVVTYARRLVRLAKDEIRQAAEELEEEQDDQKS